MSLSQASYLFANIDVVDVSCIISENVNVKHCLPQVSFPFQSNIIVFLKFYPTEVLHKLCVGNKLEQLKICTSLVLIVLLYC